MNLYSIALFLHIMGALGLFLTLGLEWMGLFGLRRAATVDQVRSWLYVSRSVGRVGLPAMLEVVISGAYMMAAAWGPVPWILVSIGAIVLLMASGMAILARRMGAIGKAAAQENGPIPFHLRQMLHSPLLWITIQTRMAVGLGIIYLMSVKPGLYGSLITMGVAIVLGLASGLLVMGQPRPQSQEEPAM